ncbi:coiled-coil domain-containing protein 15 [Megalops cyprinoides]|uniref:coiled-coil domain-containing protein 15 n=1 Tax=Megalops cyprinoides TaxID=118141 RepID=UPI001864EE50|nr:coiled-coil domain-containing protein 15 [Megalops cyprinoides]
MNRRQSTSKSTTKDMAQVSKLKNNPVPIRPAKPKTLRLITLADHRVLAERNQAVMPVGAWVESGQECQEHPAIRAVLTEEQQGALYKEKDENLRRFQDAVRRRVAQHARDRRRQQLQQTSQAVELEGRVLQQSGGTSRHHSPGQSGALTRPQGELAICSPGFRWVTTQGLEASDGDGESFVETGQQQEHQLSKVAKQVRRRLASCQTMPTGELVSELPGGIWKVSPTTDKPASCLQPSAGEEEEEEIPLIGQHDRPLGLQHPGSSESGKAVTFHSGPVCHRLHREPYPTGHSPAFGTDYRASQVLWPGEDKEELKRQRQSQFLMYRRLFMDIEREQVKERSRHRKHLRRISRIKADKEQQRLEEERRMETLQELNKQSKELAERERLTVERLRQKEMEKAQELERRDRAQKDKEARRFIEALRIRMKERMVLEKVELPPLCCCGESFWDSHPDTCANNCVFYNNPKAYAQALQSVLFNCELKDGNLSHRASARRIASMHAVSPRK